MIPLAPTPYERGERRPSEHLAAAKASGARYHDRTIPAELRAQRLRLLNEALLVYRGNQADLEHDLGRGIEKRWLEGVRPVPAAVVRKLAAILETKGGAGPCA